MQAISGILHNWKSDKPTLNGSIRLMYNLLEASLMRGTNTSALITLPKEEGKVKAYNFFKYAQTNSVGYEMNRIKRLKKPYVDEIKQKRNTNYFLGCNSTRYPIDNFVTFHSKELECSLVIDGTLTDKPIKSWDREFEVKMKKEGNHAELLLHILLRGDKIDEIFPTAAFSSGILTKDGLTFYTNGKRPLYIFRNARMIGFASTKQIILDFIEIAKRERSVLDLSVQAAQPETMYFARIKGNCGGILTEKRNYIEKPAGYGTSYKRLISLS